MGALLQRGGGGGLEGGWGEHVSLCQQLSKIAKVKLKFLKLKLQLYL